MEGSGVARGEGHGDENREERGVVEHVPESVGVVEGVGGGRDTVAVAVVFEGVTVCGGKPVGLSGGGGRGRTRGLRTRFRRWGRCGGSFASSVQGGRLGKPC